MTDLFINYALRNLDSVQKPVKCLWFSVRLLGLIERIQMVRDSEFSVLLAEPLTPPTFSADASPWGVGCSLMAVFFFLSPLLGPLLVPHPRSTTDSILAIAAIETFAVVLSIFIYKYRKSSQIAAKR